MWRATTSAPPSPGPERRGVAFAASRVWLALSVMITGHRTASLADLSVTVDSGRVPWWS